MKQIIITSGPEHTFYIAQFIYKLTDQMTIYGYASLFNYTAAVRASS